VQPQTIEQQGRGESHIYRVEAQEDKEGLVVWAVWGIEGTHGETERPSNE
jgi:hypothetical protein